LLGLFVVLYSPQFGLGNFKKPGSGFMPFLGGLVICLFATITFFRAFLDKSNQVVKIWADVSFQKLISVTLILIIYALLFQLLGFIVDSFLLILFLTRYMGSQNWKKSFLCSGLSSILSYLLFETWLGAQLPKGIFGF
jgi:putative tricarboxylic transport membrane protein